MTSQYRHRRSSDPTKAFTQLEPGEIAVNTANRQLALGDAASGAVGNPLALLPLRYFDVRAKYAAGDMVYYSNVVYRSIGVSGPGAFTPGQWTMLVGTIDPQYVAKAGDTMTGLLTLSGNPSTGLQATTKQYTDDGDAARVAKAGDTMTGLLVLPAAPPTLATHATNKDYVDNALANKSSVIVSDTPPAGAIDNTLWWESDTGLLYVRYNDGSSVQWTIACPQPDTSLFVQRVGDTMTGPLVLPMAAPTLTTHATNKAYVDATAKVFSNKNYVVNGAMMVSQENGTAAGNASGLGYFPVDMFNAVLNGTSGIASAAIIAAPTPGGSPYRVRLLVTTVDVAVGASDFVLFQHKIEGLRCADLRFGSASAKTVTLRFGVNAPAGTYCATLINSSVNRSYVAEYVIAAGEANIDVIKSLTIPGDVTGTWNTDNTTGIEIRWGLMVGSANQQSANSWGTGNAIGSSNQFNFMGTVNNAFYLFDVSLTEGPNAPPFVVPDYADELTACQRYWQVTEVTNAFNAAAVGQFSDIGAYFRLPFRAAPTVAIRTAGSRSNLSGTPSVASPTANGSFRHILQAAAAGQAYAQVETISGNARL